MGKLTEKQIRFVNEYLVDLNATQAAIRSGYKEKTAAQSGCNLMRKPYIQEAIQRAQEKRAQRTEVDQDFVIGELLNIARQPAADYLDSPLKVSNKIKALELLGKHLGIFTEHISISAADPKVVAEVERLIHDAAERG